MTILLLVLGVLAVLDLLTLVRWMRADTDGRPPAPPYASFRGPLGYDGTFR